tara:strand:- start:4941 stop:5534 length:594 start_codon:yes stop_codon:yes gene_type:complete
MASIGYLWKNRIKFPFGSKLFLKTWGKRILTFNSLMKRNFIRRRLVKYGAQISETAEIGQINAHGSKHNLRIGKFTFLGRVDLALHDKIHIGEKVCINDGVIILTASHDLNDPLWRHKKSPIVIEDFAWIATNAIILPGVTIGKGAVVGAGAIVSKNVPPYCIAAGNPAQIISKKRTEILEYNPCEFLAANLAWLKG